MCRLLCVMAESAVDMRPHLRAFARLSRESKEYQGHGWGCAWLDDGAWRLYRTIEPVWLDDLERFPVSRLLVAHARSAYRDEGISVQNNMPFFDGRYVFAFNGELRGVRIREHGRIGAEKVFNYVKRFDQGDFGAALARALPVIVSRTRYVRAMNIVVADTDNVHVSSLFSEDPDYFELQHCASDGAHVICSQRYPEIGPWSPIGSGSIRCFATAGEAGAADVPCEGSQPPS